MKIYYWQGQFGLKNFGDEINTVLWQHLLPSPLLSMPNHTLVGIGTLLNDRLPSTESLLILGSGVGYGPLPPNLDQAKVYCVRGPLSAHLLGLDEGLGICDPGILVSELYPPSDRQTNYRFGFMPHWMNRSEALKNVCDNLNVLYIDPSLHVEEVIAQLKSVDILYAEAMHGSIAADAFRIPWIPVCDSTNPHSLKGKWVDWCASMNLTYQPFQIPSLNPNTYESLSTFSKVASEGINLAIRKGKPILSNENFQRFIIDKLKSKINLMINDFQN